MTRCAARPAPAVPRISVRWPSRNSARGYHRTTGCANRIGELKSNCQKHFYRRVTVNKQITSGFSKGASYTRGCKCAYPTDEFHGWGCKITGDHCMFLFPDSKSCATRYGEGPDADASCDSAESSS